MRVPSQFYVGVKVIILSRGAPSRARFHQTTYLVHLPAFRKSKFLLRSTLLYGILRKMGPYSQERTRSCCTI
eukprot:127364-Pelagomonas_calceolata.AAC.1